MSEAEAPTRPALDLSPPPRHEPPLELTILMPCLNEARTLAVCIAKARSYLLRSGVAGEVLIADNGSTDGSQMAARAGGARLVDVAEQGYGAALMGGIRAARGRFVIMADSDDSYDFADLDAFVARLREGWQLVMGNRFAGGIRPGAMPMLHRYLGNPMLTALGRLLYGSPCSDFHCGLRGFDRASVLALGLQAPGMEFASEMVVKAAIWKLRVTEVPTTLSPDGRGRGRKPHLRSWRDGWRHLRFLLLFSPRALFLYPGVALFALGLILMAVLLVVPVVIGRMEFDIHTLLYAAAAVLLGWQSIIFWGCAKQHGLREGIAPADPRFEAALRVVTLERSLRASLLLFLLGVALGVYALGTWGGAGFGKLDPSHTMRIVIPSVTLILLAAQTAFGAAFLAVLQIRRAVALLPHDALGYHPRQC